MASFSGIYPSVLHQVSIFLHTYTEFHDMQTECQRSGILVNLLLYFVLNKSPITCDQIFFITYHLIPIPRSLITFYITITLQSLTYPYCLLPNHSIANTNPSPGFLLSKLLPECSIAPTNPVLRNLAPQSLAPYNPHIPWLYIFTRLTT